MQLVSIQSLLVLGVLMLPVMAASLPQGQTSNVISTGHLLHRRFQKLFDKHSDHSSDTTGSHSSFMNADSNVAANYHSIPYVVARHGEVMLRRRNVEEQYGTYPKTLDITERLKAGVLRHPNEKHFYKMLKEAIHQLMPEAKQEKTQLLEFCDAALQAVTDPKIQQTKCHISFGMGMLNWLLRHTELEREDYNRIRSIIVDLDRETCVPRDLVEYLANAIPENLIDDFERKKNALYLFLQEHVYGYDVQDTGMTDMVIGKMKYLQGQERERPIVQLIEQLADNYHDGQINSVITTINDDDYEGEIDYNYHLLPNEIKPIPKRDNF